MNVPETVKFEAGQIWRREGPCHAVRLLNRDRQNTGWFVEEFDYALDANGDESTRHIRKREFYVEGNNPLRKMLGGFNPSADPMDYFRLVEK